MKIVKVISGGQTGADQAGLRAAFDCGIPTGGWLPLGCRTLEGPRRDFLTTYNMKEYLLKPGYPARTEMNVRYSDVTLRFASDWNSPGELCTLKYLKKWKKPFFDIDFDLDDPPRPKGTLKFLEKTFKDGIWWQNNYKEGIWSPDAEVTVNIAGNSAKTDPGIEDLTYEYLCKLFKLHQKELRKKGQTDG